MFPAFLYLYTHTHHTHTHTHIHTHTHTRVFKVNIGRAPKKQKPLRKNVRKASKLM